MGIELPSPQGEHFGSVGNVERTAPIRPGEALVPQQGVEVNATEFPASQEVRNVPGASDGNNQSLQVDASSTTAASSAQATAVATVSLDDIPVVAADEDLIEKQWVDSVKRIIKETRTDPYRQGQAISRLQADYLQKRYGKTVASEGGA